MWLEWEELYCNLLQPLLWSIHAPLLSVESQFWIDLAFGVLQLYLWRNVQNDQPVNEEIFGNEKYNMKRWHLQRII